MIESWFNQDVKQAVKVQYLDGNVFSQDNKGNRIGVYLFEGENPVDVSGTISANVIRADGATVAVTGAASGNAAYVDLPSAAYAVPGVISVIIKATSGSDITTLCAVVANVYQSSTDSAVDPGTIIPSIQDLIDDIEAAVASIPADYSDLWKTLAPAFDSSTSYRVGQYCTYDGKMYRFTSAHSGNWNSSHATAVNIGFELNANIGSRVPHFPNFNDAAVGALTFAYTSSSGTYTVTKNRSFQLYGAYDNVSGLVGVGSSGFPFPSSVSGVVTGNNFAYLCFDRTDTTEATWQIVSGSGFRSNVNLCPLCFFFHGQAYFYDDNIKNLFTNTLAENGFASCERQTTAGMAFYDSYVCNIGAMIRGTANLVSAEYKVVFTSPIFAPNYNVGGINQALNGQTITVDWSAQANPTYARSIYLDTSSNTFLCVYSGNLTSDELFANRINKNHLALVCIVYQGTFVYTCGSYTPGRWFVNGKDIYGGTSNEFPPDLYKTFKKVGVCGDSLSVGYMYNKETETATSRMLQYSWPKQAMRDAGGNPWLNLGTSGQNVLTWCSSANYGKVQAEASGNKCQAYIIGLGENDQSDSARHVDLGTSADIVDNYQTVATTYYGGYARIIQILKHINPDAKIFCLTNPRTGGSRAEYNVAVRYIAGTYYTAEDNVFLVDLATDDTTLFNGSSFLPTDAADITGGHYSAVGYTRIATIMEDALTKAIEGNQAQFIDVAFVPYDTTDPTPNTMTE